MAGNGTVGVTPSTLDTELAPLVGMDLIELSTLLRWYTLVKTCSFVVASSCDNLSNTLDIELIPLVEMDITELSILLGWKTLVAISDASMVGKVEVILFGKKVCS
jgi:hypothetical protein